MSFDIQTLTTIATFLAGAGSTLWAGVQWYASTQKKAYAAQRDFEHLRRNQEQMKQGIEQLMKEVDALGDDMKTQSALFNLLMARSGESVSGILGYRKPRDPEA